ncbi:hypothetical protein TNCV_3652451 [Trichonephila clavipes]|nr:hypothetical protein TNCV_3652451 [Trichonephila clavipes]
MTSLHSLTVQPIPMKIGMYKYPVWRRFLCYPLCCSSPPSTAASHPLLDHPIHRQALHRIAKNDANLALWRTVLCVAIESPLECKE